MFHTLKKDIALTTTDEVTLFCCIVGAVIFVALFGE